jgi:cytochrome aa3 quinol oxidase subunit 2 (EC 1.10.3.-)
MRFKKFSRFLAALVPLLFASGCDMVVFQPKGPQAEKITDLIQWSLIWIGLIVLVVIGLFIFVIWKYRASRNPENYNPEEHGNKWIEIIWTAIPIIIVILLIIPTKKVLYDLEEIPEGYEDKSPLVIHVTSADWKWIFSYPDQNIETVNYVNIPVNRPVLFKLTSAGTMQSFWIPSLTGQKYTMAKMETELYVVADHEGTYYGRNTNFNGQNYAAMEFEVLVQSEKDFEKWVDEVQDRAPKLTQEQYEKILQPSVLGRMSFSNTHLEWVNHADHHAKEYLNPELYRKHGYPGRIFYKGSEGEPMKNHGGETHAH